MDLKPEQTFTHDELNEYVREFGRKFPYLFLVVPEAKRGGTYHYCIELVEVQISKLDKIGRRTGRTEAAQVPCNNRFRLAKRYRRHWRKKHSVA